MRGKKTPKNVEYRSCMFFKPGRFYRRGKLPSIDGVLVDYQSRRAYVETQSSVPEERRSRRSRAYMLSQHVAEPYNIWDAKGEGKLTDEDVDSIEDLQLIRAWHDAQQSQIEPEQAKFISRALYAMVFVFGGIMGLILWKTGSLPLLGG